MSMQSDDGQPPGKAVRAPSRWTRAVAWLRGLAGVRAASQGEPVRLQWTPKLMERFWNGFAQTRLTELSFSRLGGKSLIAAIAHLLPKEGRILDFGAGDGELIKMMCMRGLHVAGYEPSEERGEQLRKNLENVPGFLGAIGAHCDDKFDVVLLVEVIEHVIDEQLDSTLKSLAAFIHTGGTLIVTTPNNEDLDLNMAYCPVSNTLFHRWQHVRSFTRESLVSLLANYGFEEVATHQLEFRDDLYLPYDELWGLPAAGPLPPHMAELRTNTPTRAGAQTNLVYIGRRLSWQLHMDNKYRVSEKVELISEGAERVKQTLGSGVAAEIGRAHV